MWCHGSTILPFAVFCLPVIANVRSRINNLTIWGLLSSYISTSLFMDQRSNHSQASVFQYLHMSVHGSTMLLLAVFCLPIIPHVKSWINNLTIPVFCLPIIPHVRSWINNLTICRLLSSHNSKCQVMDQQSYHSQASVFSQFHMSGQGSAILPFKVVYLPIFPHLCSWINDLTIPVFCLPIIPCVRSWIKDLTICSLLSSHICTCQIMDQESYVL